MFRLRPWTEFSGGLVLAGADVYDALGKLVEVTWFSHEFSR